MAGPPDTRRGYEPFEVVSSLQKAIRRSLVKEAVYWSMELYASGHATWMWNRLEEILSEDIGPADRYLPATIKALRETSDEKRKKKNAGGMEAVHAVILLATAKKSGISCWMVMEATGNHHERLPVPDEALDQHTQAGRQMGRGVEHFIEVGQVKIDPETAAQKLGFESMQEMLDDLELVGLEHWAREMRKDPSLPSNPWASRNLPKIDTSTSGHLSPPEQLALDDEGDR